MCESELKKIKIVKSGSGSKDKPPKSQLQLLMEKRRNLKNELSQVEREIKRELTVSAGNM